MIDQIFKQAALRKPPMLEDRIYAAGFFDGDGHAGVHRRRSRNKRYPERWQFNAYAGLTKPLASTTYELLRAANGRSEWLSRESI